VIASYRITSRSARSFTSFPKSFSRAASASQFQWLLCGNNNCVSISIARRKQKRAHRKRRFFAEAATIPRLRRCPSSSVMRIRFGLASKLQSRQHQRPALNLTSYKSKSVMFVQLRLGHEECQIFPYVASWLGSLPCPDRLRVSARPNRCANPNR
jgi:hypothetical protein